MRGCHQQGTRINAEIANPAIICDLKRRQLAESKLSPSISFSAKRRPRLSARRAAFYYLPAAAGAHNLNCLRVHAAGHTTSVRNSISKTQDGGEFISKLDFRRDASGDRAGAAAAAWECWD